MLEAEQTALPQDTWSEPQLKYIMWLSLPQDMRPEEIRTKRQLASALGMSVDTLDEWELAPSFWPAVYERARSAIGHDLAKILQAMSAKAMAGNVQAAKLCLQTLGVQDETIRLKHEVAQDQIIVERPQRQLEDGD